MAIEIKVPTVGESISEVTLVKWYKQDGGWANRDEVIAELESEKATFEINAEVAGAIKIIAREGDTLKIGDIICSIEPGTDHRPPTTDDQPQTANAKPQTSNPKPETPNPKPETSNPKPETTAPKSETTDAIKTTPVAAAIISDKKIDAKNITASGIGGKIVKQDVLDVLNNPGRKPGIEPFGRTERPQKMSNLRKTVSRRLVEAKNTTAMLTTFNEVDMSAIMEFRAKHKDKFKETHGVNLGFMSFFTKACCYALQEWPAVNAYIDGENIIYHDYCYISIAVSAPKGLVVPVIRNAESLSMAGIESKVVELATKAKENKLTIEEMSGGTFTITNGGIFGSMMSTPIINIPQSAILGMHKIQERPVAINGTVVIRPMMYLALSYDHRIIDGRESVSFLIRVKELLENPALLLFGKDPIKSLLEI
ncbi:MAG: 2-oxoglutarate dehydrogenase complex dihydrolipoyllysine-residue succinyltransferase [Chitinophagaceae bacterium]|nr:2-oxoglutarate dehydrogenase complex dihydrolipoyllysine-residue succinyltransferase [Chitinophagaceae bacterium]